MRFTCINQLLPGNIILEVDLKVIGVVLGLYKQNRLFAVDLNRMVPLSIVEEPLLDDINRILFGSEVRIFQDD
jgi:hypothetical protein